MSTQQKAEPLRCLSCKIEVFNILVGMKKWKKPRELQYFTFSLYVTVQIGIYLNSVNDISEGQFGGKSETVVDDRLSVVKVSHVQSCRKKKEQRL